jgi:hypothetical protein
MQKIKARMIASNGPLVNIIDNTINSSERSKKYGGVYDSKT